ncbi:MAG TPA: hypothetical protein VK629_18105 [Steroidobacteraceae bacterium]|nr:hypothetical protein [Steroidobacteraceae bacterium]
MLGSYGLLKKMWMLKRASAWGLKVNIEVGLLSNRCDPKGKPVKFGLLRRD